MHVIINAAKLARYTANCRNDMERISSRINSAKLETTQMSANPRRS